MAVNCYASVPVAPLALHLEAELQRRAAVALDRHPRAAARAAGARSRQAPHASRRPSGTGGRSAADRMSLRARGPSRAPPRPPRGGSRHARSPSPSSDRLPASTRAARTSRSTNTASAAPRERASIPSAPLPANRSITRSPSTSPSIANSASWTRSEVGRWSCPAGALKRRPPRLPAITRTGESTIYAASGSSSSPPAASQAPSSACSGALSSGSSAVMRSPWRLASSSSRSSSGSRAKR